MNDEVKKIRLIDLEDPRRGTRIQLLERAGYIVELRPDFVAAKRVSDEGTYDLIIAVGVCQKK